MSDISQMLGRVEGKLDALISTMTDHIADDRVNHTDANRRLGTLEKGRAWMMGACAAVGAVASLAIEAIRPH